MYQCWGLVSTVKGDEKKADMCFMQINQIVIIVFWQDQVALMTKPIALYQDENNFS